MASATAIPIATGVPRSLPPEIRCSSSHSVALNSPNSTTSRIEYRAERTTRRSIRDRNLRLGRARFGGGVAAKGRWLRYDPAKDLLVVEHGTSHRCLAQFALVAPHIAMFHAVNYRAWVTFSQGEFGCCFAP